MFLPTIPFQGAIMVLQLQERISMFMQAHPCPHIPDIRKAKFMVKSFNSNFCLTNCESEPENTDFNVQIAYWRTYWPSILKVVLGRILQKGPLVSLRQPELVMDS